MNNKTHLLKRLSITGSLVIAAALMLSGCNLFSPAVPTVDPAAQQATVDAAVAQALQAYNANLTQTAAALPTSTFTATATLEPTATFTPAATATLAPTATNTRVPYHPGAHQYPHPLRLYLQVGQHLPGSWRQAQSQRRF